MKNRESRRRQRQSAAAENTAAGLIARRSFIGRVRIGCGHVYEFSACNVATVLSDKALKLRSHCA